METNYLTVCLKWRAKLLGLTATFLERRPQISEEKPLRFLRPVVLTFPWSWGLAKTKSIIQFKFFEKLKKNKKSS